MSNIRNDFKKELGYITATIQYTELAKRKLLKNYGEEINSSKFIGLAKEEGLSVSELYEDYDLRLSKSYIVSVYSCLEKFLMDFKSLPGSPVTKKSLQKEESTLELVWNNSISDKNSEITNYFYICDYYRLVRNCIVHQSDKTSAFLKARFSLIKKDNDLAKLNAPNLPDNLNFDDQVLLSRAARHLVEFIFTQSTYDMDAIVDKHVVEIKKIIKPLNGSKRNKKVNKIINAYLKNIYPEFSKESLNYIIEQIDI